MKSRRYEARAAGGATLKSLHCRRASLSSRETGSPGDRTRPGQIEEHGGCPGPGWLWSQAPPPSRAREAAAAGPE